MENKGDGPRLFAATVLGIAGIMRFFDAIWAGRYSGTLPDNLENALFGTSLNTYGWVYLIVAHHSALAAPLGSSSATRSAAGSASSPGPSWPSAQSGGCRTTRCGR